MTTLATIIGCGYLQPGEYCDLVQPNGLERKNLSYEVIGDRIKFVSNTGWTTTLSLDAEPHIRCKTRNLTIIVGGVFNCR